MGAADHDVTGCPSLAALSSCLHQDLRPVRSQPAFPMMPGMRPERRSHDYARNGTTSLFATFSITDGTVSSELHRRHRAAEFRKFFIFLGKAVPPGLTCT